MYKMRVRLLYKDGTSQELRMAVPEAVGDQIAVKGLVATTVYIDKFIQVPVRGLPDNMKFDDYKGGFL